MVTHTYHQDGKSAMEIAEQCGNQDIITIFRRHTTTTTGNVIVISVDSYGTCIKNAVLFSHVIMHIVHTPHHL